MVVHSRHLRAALAAVVGYYPGFASLEQHPLIEAPFAVLVHHWKALEQYKHNQPDCHDAEYAATTSKHIDVLLAFLDEAYGGKVALESARWSNPLGPTATFDLFWLLLQPGEVVYYKDRGQLLPFVVSLVDHPIAGDSKEQDYLVYI